MSIDKLLAAITSSLPGKDPENFTAVIDNKEPLIEGARLLRTMDTAADTFSASIPWDIDDKEITNLLKPFGYQSAAVYLGGELRMSGRAYTIINEVDPKGRKKTVVGWSYTVDIIDSTVIPPLQQENVTLEARAKALLEPKGIGVVVDLSARADMVKPFDRVIAQPREKIFDHLAKLASERGVLISSTPEGELLFLKAIPNVPLGNLMEDFPPGEKFVAKFEGRKRFNTYRATATTPGRKKSKPLIATADDSIVPESRSLTFSANNATLATIQSAADWQRSKRLVDTLTIPFPVSSWYNIDTGDLWRENTYINVISPTIGAPNGFVFLIRAVEYIYEDKGTKAILHLVPPNVYTGLEVIEPWL